ncbi:MAG TPA: DUF5916 domain-containing protein [Gemmatimonadaceae bacterium]
MRTTKAPVIDGKGDDAIWETAQVIDGFRTFDPVDDGDPRFRTEARVAYDEHNLYVLVRAFDPHPDSIVALLSRRDVRTQSEWLKLIIDGYHDRRTGIELSVNPAGVKRDFAVLNDGEEDASWDGVWDVGTRIDSLGWVAEFRVPLNQLRYPAADKHTFGFAIWRDVARYNERYAWPRYSRSKGGLSSQLGDLGGIDGIASPRRLEVAPYTVAKTANVPATNGYKQTSSQTAGADVKYGITSNLTLDATVNPDFGQVEADPSVLNLSAFETFFPEKRPFFLEGQGLFRFDLSCNDGSCSGLFYSRRIGRAPQLSDQYADQSNATSSTILGAAKLTGRLGNGLSVGVLDAVTQRELSPADETIEPQTNYFVGRMQQDFRQGQSAIGAMVTSVKRDNDRFSNDLLRTSALAGGIDARHQFWNRNYEVSGYWAASDVRGSADAIALTQQSFVHNYQRPDDNIAFDPTRTSLNGYASQINIAKRGGGNTLFSTGFSLKSPGFEINDVGYLSRANSKNQSFWFQYRQQTPKSIYRFWNFNVNEWTGYTWDNLRTDFGGNINAHMQLQNSMWLHFGQGINAGSTYCDNCTRGGPAIRNEPSQNGWAGIEGDPRNRIIPYLWYNWGSGDRGRSRNWNINPTFDFRATSRVTGSMSYNYDHTVSGAQFNGNYGDAGIDTTHYTVARLDQTTRSVTFRLGVTATPNLSLQLYAAPFATRGGYSDWQQVANARASQWTDRYRSFDNGDPGAFDFKQYRSNTVVRWEYRPGSALYFVWAQERTQSFDANDARLVSSGLGQLRSAHPDNVFLVKGSYWISY